MHIKRWMRIAAAIMLLAMLTACGGTTDDNVGVFTGAPDQGAIAGTGGSGGGGASNNLTVDTAEGATLEYAEKQLTASAGSIQVTFNNKGAIPHNWTLVKPGEEEAAVDAALNNGAPEYAPDNAIVHTKMANGGESDTVSATVEAGTYTYLCTFPGHYAAGMKGTLEVQAGGGDAAGGGGGGDSITADTAEGATLAYAETSLTAQAGTINVTFNNKGVIPHNWALAKAGEEQAVVDAALNNGAPEYAPDNAIVHTKMANGGESDTVSATVEPGTYTYLCTFPGHYAAGMKGTLEVQGGGGSGSGDATGGGAAGGGATVDVQTADGANLKYAEESLTAKAGALTVNFANVGVIPHNWVLAKAGEEQAVVDAALNAGAPEYAPDNAIVHTKMANGGESDTVSATVEAGTYTYLCTFPGHYAAGMKGTLTVEP